MAACSPRPDLFSVRKPFEGQKKKGRWASSCNHCHTKRAQSFLSSNSGILHLRVFASRKSRGARSRGQ
eukprot:363267-Chlamydomonas_euryale.AAC.18